MLPAAAACCRPPCSRPATLFGVLVCRNSQIKDPNQILLRQKKTLTKSKHQNRNANKIKKNKIKQNQANNKLNSPCYSTLLTRRLLDFVLRTVRLHGAATVLLVRRDSDGRQTHRAAAALLAFYYLGFLFAREKEREKGRVYSRVKSENAPNEKKNNFFLKIIVGHVTTRDQQ